MTLSGKKIGVALTGSYCTFDTVFPQIERLVQENNDVTTIFSDRSQVTDTRFGKANDFLNRAKIITGKDPITTIVDAEKIGPQSLFDIVIIAPCTGNTLAKLANAITDSPVLMAAKSQLRNNKPVVIAMATNDALSNNLKNIGFLLGAKNVYFVPFGQDNYKSKPYSMVADFNYMLPTLEEALSGKQLQPIVIAPK
ncbi:MAG: dpaB [Herbinix sp.]|jgi:dipicolinate synthase subunit B|nr:dpaB [Herbinix sp.]